MSAPKGPRASGPPIHQPTDANHASHTNPPSPLLLVVMMILGFVGLKAGKDFWALLLLQKVPWPRTPSSQLAWLPLDDDR